MVCVSWGRLAAARTCVDTHTADQAQGRARKRHSGAGMDVTFGVVGDGFVLLVSDTSRVQSILVQRTEVDKILQLDSHKLLARAPLCET